MPLYVGDYLADTRHLSTLEHGAYLLLLMHYWQTGSLPTKDDQLARIAGLTLDEWSNGRSTMAAFFEEGWRHKRVEFELAKAKKLSDAGRTGGLASGEARRATINERPLNGSGNDPPTKHEAPQSPSQSLHKREEVKSSVGEGREARPPRHGAKSRKAGGRVYVVKGTSDWEAYAADYREARGVDPPANKHGGKWFKIAGEGAA